jgi:glycosyltransferase involved in cell wall biosynthesis
MACGTAVITTPVGTDDYALNNENSLVVPSKSPGKLAEAILKLIEDPKLASHLAESGIQTARRFNWDKATDNMEAILEKELRSFRPNRFTDIFKLINT